MLTTHSRSRPRPGEIENGDAVLVRHTGRFSLVAVIDALGHGPVAAQVASTAVRVLTAATLPRRPEQVLLDVHEALRGTRGAAATVVTLEDGIMRGCGVGNVEVRTHGRGSPVLLARGVLGSTTVRPRPFDATLAPGERFAIFTDGLTRRLHLDSVRDLALPDACDALFARFAQELDDATLLVGEVRA